MTEVKRYGANGAPVHNEAMRGKIMHAKFEGPGVLFYASLGNHDNARLGNRRSDDDLEIIYAFGLTMPGVTFIYYGNEIGMRQMPEDWPQVEGAYRPRNGARTPMQWARGKNLGFSSCRSALPPCGSRRGCPDRRGR